MKCSIDGCGKARATAKRGLCKMHETRERRHGSPYVTLRITEGGLEARLVARTVPGDSPDDCWRWDGATNDAGYGQFWFKGRLRYAHRVSWEVANGRSPGRGLVVRHSCDNPPCTNPRHLLVGTVADNNDDKVRRGRAVYAVGTAVGSAKLNPQLVREIRMLYRSGWSKSEIARRMGCAQPTIRNVLIGKTWAHVPDTGDVIPATETIRDIEGVI